MNIFTQFFTKRDTKTLRMSQRIRKDLLQREAQVGKSVFGPVPASRKREFFRIDQYTWIWEETVNGRLTRTKYVVREREVVKSVNGASYQRLTPQEARHFNDAVQLYVQRVASEVYGQPAIT